MCVEPPCASINRAHEVKPSSNSYVYHAGPVMSRLPSDTVFYIKSEAHVSTLAISDCVH
jgi:hypothetical protein